jgi:5,10-methenyltetrahydrofolate synthetase
MAADDHQHDDSRIARSSEVPEGRAAARRALLETRRRLSAQGRHAVDDALLARLGALLGNVAGETIAIYWAIRGEPSIEPLALRWSQAGARLALPVVTGPAQPLRFVSWRPGDPTVAGAMGIPQPAGGEALRPTLLVLPCVGFDARGYRLGYGGGYYDRSLAVLDADGGPPPRAIGVAWDEARMDGFEPLPTDRPLDAVVTPSRVIPPGAPNGR